MTPAAGHTPTAPRRPRPGPGSAGTLVLSGGGRGLWGRPHSLPFVISTLICLEHRICSSGLCRSSSGIERG